VSGFRMKIFSSLGGASLSLSIGNATLKTADINVKKNYQFEPSVKDDQIYVKNCECQNC
jgi:hypothetical protein